MERFTFDEIKNFKVNDIFWAKNGKWKVMDDPIYYNKSMFYGDFSEKVEWVAYNDELMQSHTFIVHNIHEGNPSETLIFKTSVSENIETTSNLKKG